MSKIKWRADLKLNYGIYSIIMWCILMWDHVIVDLNKISTNIMTSVLIADSKRKLTIYGQSSVTLYACLWAFYLIT